MFRRPARAAALVALAVTGCVATVASPEGRHVYDVEMTVNLVPGFPGGTESRVETLRVRDLGDRRTLERKGSYRGQMIWIEERLLIGETGASLATRTMHYERGSGGWAAQVCHADPPGLLWPTSSEAMDWSFVLVCMDPWTARYAITLSSSIDGDGNVVVRSAVRSYYDPPRPEAESTYDLEEVLSPALGLPVRWTKRTYDHAGRVTKTDVATLREPAANSKTG